MSSVCPVWQRCTRYRVFIGQFPQNSRIISGSFAERDLQFKACNASSPPCVGCCSMLQRGRVLQHVAAWCLSLPHIHNTAKHLHEWTWISRICMLLWITCKATCCSMLQRVAACCSVLQHVAACCSLSQCVAVCFCDRFFRPPL